MSDDGKPVVQGYRARCEACDWHGTDIGLIWVSEPFVRFFRCPRCRSHRIWIMMGKHQEQAGEEEDNEQSAT